MMEADSMNAAEAKRLRFEMARWHIFAVHNIPKVAGIWVYDDPCDFSIWTTIDGPHYETEKALSEVEMRLMSAFPEVRCDFHSYPHDVDIVKKHMVGDEFERVYRR